MCFIHIICISFIKTHKDKKCLTNQKFNDIMKVGFCIYRLIIWKGDLKMIVDRSYKISAFGNFSSISATAESLLYYLEAFKKYGLVPSIYQELSMQNGAIQPFPVQRIALVSADNKEKITIGLNRIDYEIIASDDIKISCDKMEEYNSRIIDSFELILKAANLSASRLALNAEALVINLSQQELDLFLAKYTNPISLFEPQSMTEWSTRLVSRKSDFINGSSEDFNVIAIIQKTSLQKQVNGQVELSNGFSISIDINTIAENTLARFEAVQVEEFIKVSTNWYNTILREVGN